MPIRRWSHQTAGGTGREGRSGGYRTIIAYRRAGLAVFLYGFAKNERDNIAPDELKELRQLGQNWLNAPTAMISADVERGILREVGR